MPDQEHYSDGVERWFGWQDDGRGQNDYEDASQLASDDAAKKVEEESKSSANAIRKLSDRAEVIRGMLVVIDAELTEIITVMKDEADAQAQGLLDIFSDVTRNAKHDVEIPYPRVNLAEILSYLEDAREHVSGGESTPNLVECVSELADVWHKTKGTA